MIRGLLLFSGIVLLAATWLGPLPDLARQAFFAHMTMHMAVVAVAAPLIAFGIAGGPLDPVLQAPRLFAPVPASVVELVVVWAWHAPGLHHGARRDTLGFAFEQGMFLTAGLLVWVSSVGGLRGDRSRRGAGILGLLLTSMHMTLLGALLALSPRPLYEHIERSASFENWMMSPLSSALCRPPDLGLDGLAGLTDLEDQHLGGAIMLMVGGVSYLLGGLWLTAGMLRELEFARGEPP